MKTRILTGLLFSMAMVLFVAPGFWTPVFPMVLLLVVLATAWWEMDRVLASRRARPTDARPLGVGVLAGGVTTAVVAYLCCQTHAAGGACRENGFFTFLWQGPGGVVAGQFTAMAALAALAAGMLILVATAACHLVVCMLSHGPACVAPAASMLAGATYVALPLYMSIAMLYTVPRAMYWLIPALAAPWLTDVTAYFVGSWFGKHKIVPRISPKKTWEGSIGGLAGCVVAMMCWFGLIFPHESGVTQGQMLWTGLALGAMAGVAAQAGDWVASAIKRWAGVKDFGTMFPGHGGVLDRFDSVLFTMPIFVAGALLFATI